MNDEVVGSRPLSCSLQIKKKCHLQFPKASQEILDTLVGVRVGVGFNFNFDFLLLILVWNCTLVEGFRMVYSAKK